MTIERDPSPTTATRQEASYLLGTWASGLLTSAGVLVMNLRDLQPPLPWGGSDVWQRWAAHHEPDLLVAAIVVPVALVLVCLLAVVVAGTGVAVLVATRRGRAVRCSDRWPTAVASFVAAVTVMAGGPAAASTGSGASAGGDIASRPLVELVDGTATVPTTTAPTTPPPTATPTSTVTSTSVMTPTTVRPVDPPAVAPSPAPTAPAASDAIASAATVEVTAGDNLWRIAERQVAADPRQGPVLRYWLRLIDVNRPRFVEPGNPSLILPGQVLDLPQGQ